MSARMAFILVAVTFASIASGQNRPSFHFVENRGQWPSDVDASVDLQGGKLFLGDRFLTYHFFDLSNIRLAHDEGKSFDPKDVRIKGHVYRVEFLNSSKSIASTFDKKQEKFYNYFIGKDKSKWAGGCNSFDGITEHEVYPGIDIHYYSSDFFLKYDFIVKSGADAHQIRMKYDGAEKIFTENGRLIIQHSIGESTEQKPLAWQIISGIKQLVECRFEIEGNVVSFLFPKGYNKQFELIIDPELVFSTYSGSSSDNFGYTATYDEEGYLYSGSSAFGQQYPTTTGAYQTTHQGGDSGIEEGIDMALSKYDVTGTFMVWSTFLGGAGDDLPHSIITNSEGELIVYGSTGSIDFPTTDGAIQDSFMGGTVVAPSGTGANFPNGSDIVVARFNVNCTELLGSTYIGGTGNDGVCTSPSLKHNYADEFRGEISLDENEDILIVSSTFSFNFPTSNAIQNTNGGGQDAVIMKLNPTLSNMIWGTYFGGTGDDSGFSITDNDAGELYICGGTTSTDLNLGNTGVQTNNAGGLADGYILKLSATGNSVLSGTFWGSNQYDQLYFIEIDNEDKVYVFGQTTAPNESMIINAGYGTPSSGNLITKFDGSLSQVIWSTVFGTGNNKPNLSPSAFLVDYCNRIYISGWGITTVANNPLNPGQNLHSMNNMETTTDAFDDACSTGDFYMAVFDENMTQLEYGTFFGGGSSSEHVDGGTSRFDRKGVIYQSVCAGCGGFDDFPIYPDDAWSAVNNSSCNNGVYKFDFQLPITVADFVMTPTGCINVPIQFENTSSYAQTWHWDFGDETTSSVPNPTHQYTEGGEYTIMLVVTHNATCNGVDTIYHDIEILTPQTTNLENFALCESQQIQLGPENPDPTFTYSWSPNQFISNPSVPNPTFNGDSDMSYTLTVTHDGCIDTYFQSVDVIDLILQAPGDTTLCDDALLLLTAGYSPENATIIWSDDPDFNNQLNDGPNDPDILVEVTIPETFYVMISMSGCEIFEEVFVNLVGFQTVIDGDFTTCVNDTVELSVVTPNPEFNYSWSPELLIISGQNSPSVEVYVPEETTFYVVSETPFECSASDSVTVTVSTLTPELITATATPEIIIEGQTSQLEVEPEGFSYTWTPVSTLSNAHSQAPVASPDVTTTYIVWVNDGECQARTEVTVQVVDFVCGPPGIFVPNAFTPNADTRNEKLFVRANNITELYFVIYDRWGEKIFETTKLEMGWDGTFEGRTLDPDVYVYYLEATCLGGESYFEEGNITLIR